jgi:hypothetical protein
MITFTYRLHCKYFLKYIRGVVFLLYPFGHPTILKQYVIANKSASGIETLSYISLLFHIDAIQLMKLQIHLSSLCVGIHFLVGIQHPADNKYVYYFNPSS